MGDPQPGILAPLTPAARYLTFQLAPDASPDEARELLSDGPFDDRSVVGIGQPLLLALNLRMDTMRSFPALTGPGITIPSTPAALWVWLRGDERGELVNRARRVVSALEPAYELESVVDGFMHAGGRDLTGYEDGTENPTGDRAVSTAIARGQGDGYDGGSMVAVMQWLHDLHAFESHAPQERDQMFGRRLSDNEELEDAPPTAHVQRAEQESFDPHAYVLRRSMPWADGDGEGLMFVAFGTTVDPFERILRRMCGEDDGIVDALFRFTRPISGAYYWCPPIRDGNLDLRVLP